MKLCLAIDACDHVAMLYLVENLLLLMNESALRVILSLVHLVATTYHVVCRFYFRLDRLMNPKYQTQFVCLPAHSTSSRETQVGIPRRGQNTPLCLQYNTAKNNPNTYRFVVRRNPYLGLCCLPHVPHLQPTIFKPCGNSSWPRTRAENKKR